MDFQDITEEFEVIVAEMSSDPAGAAALVKLDPEIVARVSEGDDDPRFATVIIESGESKNGRVWKPEIFADVVEQINGSGDVVGYLGHIKPDDSGHAFPPVQMHWLKARLNVMSDRTQMYAKAYVLPPSVSGAVARDYIKRGFVKTVSWRGKAAMRPGKGVQEVTKFLLESIDLARPRTAGMKTALVGGLTSEMDEGGNNVKPEEIAALAENELRAHNPNLVKAIEDSAKKPLEDKVSEQETVISTTQPTVDLVNEIRKSLKLDEKGDVLEAIGNLVSKSKEVAKEAKAKFLDAILEKKFRDEATRNLVRRMIVTEMASGSLVSEMESVDSEDDEDKAKTKTEEVVNKFIDNDPDLKKMVSEMEGSGGASFQGGNDGRTKPEIKAGFENDLITVRKAGDGR